MKKLIYILFFSLILSSCGEEVLTQNTLSEDFTANNVDSFSLNTCSQMHFEKPPVDILFIVDNSGSTLMPAFQQIKNQIANTISTISNEFNYHIYVTPLIPLASDNIRSYPLLLNDSDSVPNLVGLNQVSLDSLNFFSSTSGSNTENGFSRAHDIINANRSNGIFRNKANTIVVMISNGNDTSAYRAINGNSVYDGTIFTANKNKLLKFSKKYAQSNYVSNPMNAESFRFISLVAHSRCGGFKEGSEYRKMSKEIYNYMGYSDDPYSKDSKDLCSGNYASLFSSINSSIRAVLVGHSYDHWLISSASAASIQSNDIQVTKISGNNQINIPASSFNGFQYLGYRSNQNTRYLPTSGEPVSGLVIKLNGNARVTYPDCIIAKTRTPTEYFGYIVLPREPNLSTVKIKVRGSDVPKGGANGWSYLGYRATKNIKVPGPTNAPITPKVNRSGYFIQLNGSSLITNGESVSVYYKPAPL